MGEPGGRGKRCFHLLKCTGQGIRASCELNCGDLLRECSDKAGRCVSIWLHFDMQHTNLF